MNDGKVRFVHWLESPFPDIPHAPMFNVPNGSTVSAESVIEDYQMALPPYPSYEKWKQQTERKRRCFRCWAAVRGNADLSHHRRQHHHEAFMFAYL